MAGVHNRRPPTNVHHPADMDGGASLTNFFNFTSKPLPVIQQNHRKVHDPRLTDECIREQYQSTEEDEDLRYVREYRQREIERIMEFNQQCTLKGHPPEPPRDSRRSQRSRRSGSGHIIPDASVQGAMDRDRGRDGQQEDIGFRYDMSGRRFDNTGLAIYSCKEKILSSVNGHQVTIIEGFTGCGKTTQVPQFLLEDAVQKNKFCRIVVTQPRRIAALSVANRVCWERGWELGSLVGYQVGMDRKFSEDSRLVYMTTGVLLQMMINKKSLEEWSHIIIDEVHERDLDTDLLMLVIKRIMIERQDTYTKVILMSATLNAKKFMDYFPNWRYNGNTLGTVIVQIPHLTTYPVTEHYINNIHGIEMPKSYKVDFYEEPKIAPDIYEMAVNIIASFDTFEKNERRYNASKPDKNGVDSFEVNERGAVLVFLPGLLEIETMYKLLNEYTASKAKDLHAADPMKWTLLPLHSTITNEDQQKVFQPVQKGHRKIILATNIAESSITVTDIKYVIDFCLTKSLSCDPTTNYTCLRLEWASKNQCIQRKGRCGRVSAGHVYRMVPEVFYNNLVQEAFPEMMKSSLESVVLHAKMLNMGSPKALLALAIDPPKLSGIRRAVANLKEVGAITIDCQGESGRRFNEFDGDLTYLGQVMARLPIDLRFGRLIMMGHVFGLLEETIIIAAGLSTKSPFSYPYHRRVQAYLSKLYWSQNTFSDCLALINVYKTWVRKFENHDFRKKDDEKVWANQYLVQRPVMREIFNLVKEIQRRLQTMNIAVNENSNLELTEERGILLKIVIAGAFYPNYFVRNRPKKNEYEKEISKELIGRNPATTVVFQGFPAEQPGHLYAHHITSQFEYGNASAGYATIPYVEPHGSKLLLSFDIRGHKIGSLCHGLYRAIKMKQLRHVISFKIIRRDHAVDALELALQNVNISEFKAPPQVTLPTVIDREASVHITQVVSPSEIYIIYQSDLERLQDIDNELNANANCMCSLRFDELTKGDLVFIELGGQYARGRVEQLSNEPKNKDVLVYRIDRGGLYWFKTPQIYAINNQASSDILFETPGLAIQCRLQEMKPPVQHGGNWPEESIKYVKSFEGYSCKIQIFSIVESVVAGDILINNSSARLTLLEKSLADSSPEPRDSEENYNLRSSSYVARQDKAVQAQFSEKQVTTKIPKASILPPPEEEDAASVTLRGPNSPLEMSFSALCRSSHSKQVNIDGASVNSVALDHDFLTPNSRLLVAGSVGIAHRSGNLMARDTTMMPAIPGLTGLLTLLFCPIVELRVNESLTQYTGALAGLGLDPLTREPIYGDHDVEVIFDTQIDNQDLNTINSIRMTMNYILRPNCGPDLSNLRQKAISDTLQLLQRPRVMIDESWPQTPHMWGDRRDGLIRMCPGIGYDNVHTDVFQLHEGISLD